MSKHKQNFNKKWKGKKPEKQKIVSATTTKPKPAKWNIKGMSSWAISAPLKLVAKKPKDQ